MMLELLSQPKLCTCIAEIENAARCQHNICSHNTHHIPSVTQKEVYGEIFTVYFAKCRFNRLKKIIKTLTLIFCIRGC